VNWVFQTNSTYPVAHAIGILSLVCVAGLALGSAKIRGVGLGVAGVLFAGIVVGHFGKPVEKGVLDFVKEFGLILFVFAIGLQLGPGFFAAFRQHGVKMNLLATLIVILGAISAPLIGWIAGFDPAAVLGVFSGASVNMPSLGAASQTISTLPGIAPERLALPALACAVTFPTAIVTTIGTLLLLKKIFRIDVKREAEDYAAKARRQFEPLERRTLRVTNPNLSGMRLESVPGRVESGVTISRIKHNSVISLAEENTVVQNGDLITVIGTCCGLEKFARVVGPFCDEDLLQHQSQIASRRVIMTARSAVGKSVGDLNLNTRFQVAVTRITRGDIEMSAVPGLRLRFGDVIQIVGSEDDLAKASAELGNSIKELNSTQFIPFFIGIFLGVVAGTMPIAFAGLPQPIRLGLAGGPLIVALILGRIGRIGPLVCHMPVNANLAFRDFGIALFFAAVGLEAGQAFFGTVFSSTGLQWLIAGAVVTSIPLLLVGIIARRSGMNFMDIGGLLSGSTTNPPALAFLTNISASDAPTVTYATVYPLTMLLRIICAQVLALTLVR
jgi:putative transport protein